MISERGRDPRLVARLLRFGAPALLALLALLGCASGTAVATAGAALDKVIDYHGYTIAVPAGWPVYSLASDPTVCVRFNRHALYLGQPSSAQRCPAHSIGRTEAILVQPISARGARPTHTARTARTVRTARTAGSVQVLPALTNRAAQPRQGSQAQVTIAARGLIVTATWNRHPSIVQRALGTRGIATDAASAPAARAAVARAAVARAGPAAPGAVYTGLGFDACSAPSMAQMSEWAFSPFLAAGIYIGGTNSACAQPNLTAAWVSAESAAGWHLIPTYVGLQAPTNSCGCARINPSQATAEGTAAAADGIEQAQALGIGTGNPIYDDMEAYPPGGTNSAAVLAFLSAWTAGLHAGGYVSGVYGSGASGIEDLAAQYGTGFLEPDDIWIADWNGEQTTSDPFVPSADWPSEQRLHQFRGSHNDTYGGATINVDSNFLDGATAAAGDAGGVTVAAPLPALTVSVGGAGAIHLSASWAGATGVSGWRVLAGANPTALTPLSAAATPGARIAMNVQGTFPYFAVQALGSAAQVLASSPVVATPAHLAIFGHSVFSPSPGLGGVPAGCFTGRPCHIVTTISAGRTVLASTSREPLPAGGSGILYFKLSPAGRALLAGAPGHRLAVKVTVRDSTGAAATSALTLVRFLTKGRGPHRSVGPPGPLRIVGATDFVSSGWVGGILAGCSAGASCAVTTTINVGASTIARGGPQQLGASELGYLIFRLTPQGHSMLARAAGNQLGAHVTITDGSATATANIALVRFG